MTNSSDKDEPRHKLCRCHSLCSLLPLWEGLAAHELALFNSQGTIFCPTSAWGICNIVSRAVAIYYNTRNVMEKGNISYEVMSQDSN
jgi:hypothetical protein